VGGRAGEGNASSCTRVQIKKILTKEGKNTKNK